MRTKLVSTARIDEAARRLLAEQFRLGLFRIPDVDASEAPNVIGSQPHRDKGLEVQKQSIVLLQNQSQPGSGKLLPLPRAAKVYTIGMGKADVERYGFAVIDGNAPGGPATSKRSGHDVAIIRVQVRNANTDKYRSRDPGTGANPTLLNPLTGKTWGDKTRVCCSRRAIKSAPMTGRWDRARHGDCSLAAPCPGRPVTFVYDDGGLAVLGNHAFAGDHSGRDERGRRHEDRTRDLLPQSLRAR